MLLQTERQAEIIPNGNVFLFHAPDLDNTSVGTKYLTFCATHPGRRNTIGSMDLSSVLDLLYEQVIHIDIIQCTVLIFGVTQVLLARSNNILLYPTGIIATIFSIYSLFHAQLFAESLLNLYYFFMSVYGWWYWSRRLGAPQLKIGYASKRDWIITLCIVFFGWGGLYLILSHVTPSDVPGWDAWISATAWAGMWLLTRRRIENWVLLNVSNAFAIPLLFQKELPLFGVLTIFLFLVACKGYFDWIKIHRRESTILLSVNQ